MPRLIHYRPSPAIAVGSVALLAAAAGVALASIPDRGGVIHACYQKQGGGLRVIDTTRRGVVGRCRKSERPLAINQQGPRGLQGAQGLQGTQGAQGLQGAKGDTGNTGPPGPVNLLWAVVNSDATLARANAPTTVTHPFGAGIYLVALSRDVSMCSYVATIGLAGNGAPPQGQISVTLSTAGNNVVAVEPANSSGTLTDLPFHLQVAC